HRVLHSFPTRRSSDLIDDGTVARAVEVMTTLNRDASEAAVRRGASAATDVTGFGFAGHAWALAVASGVELRIEARALPIFPGALDRKSTRLNSSHVSI